MAEWMTSALILCLSLSCTAVFASTPGDEHRLCRTLSSPPSEGGRVELLNSYNYINLITGFFPPPVWTQTNLDGNGNGWTEDNGEVLCRHHVRVCDYFTGSLQNNWLFTQYIRFIEAREVFVNISYNFAECQLHSSCSQTPAKLYVQYSNSVLPQHRTDTSRYHLVGELQQSTHSQGEQHTMFLVSRMSQTNQGFYLGLRDTGSCGVVRQITVYYRVCESRFNGPGLEFYPTLPLPPRNTSEPIVANAFCAPDTVSFTAPGYLAYPNGTCVYGATCKCKPGFEKIVLAQQTSTTVRCQACAEGSYRSESDTSCQQCPVNTITSDRAVAECQCANGYYRTTEEGPSSSCTAPPSDCRNIQVMDSMTTSASLTVQWIRPQTIGRDDFYYNIHYKLSLGAAGARSSGEYIQHNAVPYKEDSTTVVYTLSDFIPYTSYQIRVTLHNGVSDQHTEESMCETTATTNIGPPWSVKEYCRLIVWKPPSNSRGQVTGYEIEFSSPGEQSVNTVTVNSDEYHVLPQSDTFREFRMRAIVPLANGEWSKGIKLCERCQDTGPTTSDGPDYVDGIICVKRDGRFTCTCPTGFTGDGKAIGTGCTDIDECTDGTAKCRNGTECVNTPGGFRCDDINECTRNTDNCGTMATCVNTDGSFTCTCPPGFTGDGRESGSGCRDINECTVEAAYCVDEATFVNTLDGFTCTCPPGFTGDGRDSGSGCTGLLARRRRQVDPDKLVECFVDQNCLQDATPLEVTRRECCVGNPDGAAFRLEGEETCNVCVVFGFFQTTFTASERGQGYSISVGYLKRPRTGIVALSFTVTQELLGTTTITDFTLQTVLVSVLPNQDSRDVTFTFHVDGIAQELDETVKLKLSVSQAILYQLPGELNNSVYFLDTAGLVILDSDTLAIQFTSEDYRSSEPELLIPVKVTKRTRIATPVTVRVTPLTLTQHRLTGRPDPPGTLEDNPNSPIEADENDFDDTSVVVTFQPDETGKRLNDVDAPIGIIDDAINEAYEQNFVVTLEIICAVNTFKITISRKSALCRIFDDDDVTIGFQQPSYSFNEPPDARDSVDIIGDVLVEKENGVISEQTFIILVYVIPTTPNQAIQPAERSTDLADNDYTIGPNNHVILRMGPNDQTREFNFRLFGDDIAEGTEAFQVTSTQEQDTPEFLPPMVLSRSTFILIEEDDKIIIGFERSYAVTESVGTVEICAVVIFPAPDVPILLTDIFLSVNTIPGTAVDPPNKLNLQGANHWNLYCSQSVPCLEASSTVLKLNNPDYDNTEQTFAWISRYKSLDSCSYEQDAPPFYLHRTAQPPITIITTDISDNHDNTKTDEMDYGRIAESDATVFLDFGNENRRQCFNLKIINDDELEDTENLTIDLVFSSFFPAPSMIVILDPDVTTVTIVDNV